MARAGESTIEVGALIDGRGLGLLQLRVLILCALVVLIDGYDIQIMALAVPSVAESWGVPPSAFGLVLTASLVGIGLGGAVLAPLADRFGRRPLLVGGLFLAGLGTLMTAWSQSLEAFVFWRLLTGIGIGASQPVAATLTAEYMPQRRRAWLVTLMFCNVALGSFIAGFAAGPIMAAWGWRGLFQVGGVLTLGLSAALFLGLPESLRFLVARGTGHGAVRRILERLAPGTDPASLFVQAQESARRNVFDLLSRELRGRTLLLWTIYAFSIFVLYMLISWLPSLLRQAGWPPDQASQGAVMIQGGGVVGGLLLSTQIDRGRTIPALLFGYGLFAVALGVLTITPSSFWAWSALIFLMGAGLSGAQFILVALAAAFYPLSIRATGMGWTGTVSRVGAISAPLFGAWAMQHAGPVQVLAMMIVPALICAGLALLIQRRWLVN